MTFYVRMHDTCQKRWFAILKGSVKFELSMVIVWCKPKNWEIPYFHFFSFFNTDAFCWKMNWTSHHKILIGDNLMSFYSRGPSLIAEWKLGPELWTIMLINITAYKKCISRLYPFLRVQNFQNSWNQIQIHNQACPKF